MEVVRKNFKEALPVISESIKKADFLAIDAEFTGLLNGRDVSIFDSAEDYFQQYLFGSSDFLLIQFGLCAFYWNEEKQHYMNDAYNFYLFPRGRPGPERTFLCQSSSLDFLASNGFDFNKLIKEGISYMTQHQETKLRENLTGRHLTQSKVKEHIKIPDENKPFINDICKKVKNFIDENTLDEMEIDRCNSFVRLLLFQELRAKFNDDIVVDTKILDNKNRVLRVSRKKPDEDAEALKKKREWDELEDAVGFSKVARMISQSEKLVVGHNMLLDLIHTLNHFFQPLPAHYTSFKEFAHCMFPKLIDTKYMSSLPPFKDKLTSSVLSELLPALSEPPFSLPKVGCLPSRGYTTSNAREHEAGYDAYITGVCFLAMGGHVSRMRGDGPRLVPSSAALKPFLNKLFLAKTARQDSPYINLTGDDPSPSRDHVFHLTFPKEWQRSDLNQLFSPFGNITVQFIDDNSALVGLDRREQAASVVRALAKNALVKLTPYVDYQRDGSGDSQEIQRSDPPRTDTYKLIATPESKPKQVKSNLTLPRVTQLPEPVGRARSNSTSVVTPTRKRTSSGVFQVDESEPSPKKVDKTRSPSEVRKESDTVSNGRRKLSESDKVDAKNDKIRKGQEEKGQNDKIRKVKSEGKRQNENIVKGQKEKIVEIFDDKAKSNCVSAFKESESWD